MRKVDHGEEYDRDGVKLSIRRMAEMKANLELTAKYAKVAKYLFRVTWHTWRFILSVHVRNRIE
jgi:hypothetical protein